VSSFRKLIVGYNVTKLLNGKIEPNFKDMINFKDVFLQSVTEIDWGLLVYESNCHFSPKTKMEHLGCPHVREHFTEGNKLVILLCCIGYYLD